MAVDQHRRALAEEIEAILRKHLEVRYYPTTRWSVPSTAPTVGGISEAAAEIEALSGREAEAMREAAAKVWVVTNGERGADRRYRMWDRRAWVWTPDAAQAAHFARMTDANQILPDGSPYDYADRIAILTEAETSRALTQEGRSDG